MPPGIYKRILKPFKLRFEKKIGNKDNCWEWIGNISLLGYGHFFMNGKLEQAHRAAWKIYKGKIPKGICVCHTCDNPSCVNPKHLWLGTQTENIRDMMKKGRGMKADSAKNGGAKLNWNQVEKIRKLYKTGDYFYKELANMFGVCESQIKRIMNNWSWKI